jgi:hypothetical protein
MEIVSPAELAKHHHVWLEWLGLEAPPPDADSWVAAARGFLLDGLGADSSRLAGQLVDALEKAGIEARQRLYQFYNADPGTGIGILGQSAEMETCVAVVVHDRDLAKANTVAEGMKDELQREAQEPVQGDLSDAELTRDALEAGPPPPD